MVTEVEHLYRLSAMRKTRLMMKVVLCCRQTSSCSLIRGFRIRFSRGDEYITIAATVINFIPTLPSIYHVDCPMGGFHIFLPPNGMM